MTDHCDTSDEIRAGTLGCRARNPDSDVRVNQAPSAYNAVPTTDAAYVFVQDNNPNVFHDKPFIAADTFAASVF